MQINASSIGWVIGLIVLVLALVAVFVGKLPLLVGGLIAGLAASRLLQ